MAYAGTRRPAWQLDVTDAEALRAFVDEIGIFGKEDAVARVRAALVGRAARPAADRLPLAAWSLVAVLLSPVALGRRHWVHRYPRLALATWCGASTAAAVMDTAAGRGSSAMVMRC